MTRATGSAICADTALGQSRLSTLVTQVARIWRCPGELPAPGTGRARRNCSCPKTQKAPATDHCARADRFGARAIGSLRRVCLRGSARMSAIVDPLLHAAPNRLSVLGTADVVGHRANATEIRSYRR